ncbi:MAG: HAMP domain-containing sensor histidine kinase [Dermatophilaceae bacterium]
MRPRRFERISLRARLMTIGVLGVAGALVIGGLLLYAVLTAALTRTVAASALSSAREVALLVETNRLPDPLPVSGAQVVQVLDEQGRVVSGSPTADRLTALVTPQERQAALAGDAVVVPGTRTGLSGNLQVAAVEANAAGERLTVVAVAPTADAETSGRTLRLLLLVLFPLLLVVLAVIAWHIIGAALRPVEALRLGAARIDATSSDTERLPVPATRDEIGALATTLNEMLERVAAARRTQRAFVADAAHELRSPLASMRTQLEVARHLGEAEPLATELLADVERLARLVEDLLLLARTDDGRRGLASGDEGVDVGLLLASSVISRHAEARVPVRLTSPPDSAAWVAFSQGDLVRVLTNVIDNAVRHARTAVAIDVQARADEVVVSVSDDGHGIPEADRERVFDRFTRLDDARDRDRGGSGLGLAITRELLRRGGGTIRLADAAPGVRAVMTLPRAGPHASGRPADGTGSAARS